MNAQSLLSPKETALRLGVSEVTVIRLFNAGTLSGVVLAQSERRRIIRFRPDAVERFIQNRERFSSADISA